MSRIYELTADDVDDFDFPLEPSTSSTSHNPPRSSSNNNTPVSGLPADFSNLFAGMMGTGALGPHQTARKEADRSRTKNWETLYPRYLDAKAPYKTGGRRVAIKYSLRWPLAQLIHHACTQIGLPCQLEVDKVHPSDWQNPGRVKVLIKRNQKPIDPTIPNKYVLLCKIGTILRPLEKLRLGLPEPSPTDRKRYPLPAINLRLPYNSPAISHGFLSMAEIESDKSNAHSVSSSITQSDQINPKLSIKESSKKPSKPISKKKTTKK